MVRIVIETDADIGTADYARSFLALGARFPRWLPERFGTTEPLRGALTPQAHDEFVRMWLGHQIRPDYSVGNLLFARRRPVAYRGSISWNRGQAGLNRVSLAIQPGSGTDVYQELVTFATELFANLHGQFGFAASDEEYFTKNIVGWWVNPETGKRQGGSARAPDRSQHLPGVYWVNLFGPAYVDLFGTERLESAPAVQRERLPNGDWLIRTSLVPESWNDEATKRLQLDLIEHLGRGAFFDPQHPDQRGVAPHFNRVRSIGGQLGGVSNQTISTEFFSSAADVESFLTRVLDRVELLGRRLTKAAPLDFSVDSLHVVDDYVLSRARKKTLREDQELAVQVAAYYGEVVRRNLRGRWKVDPTDPLMPIVELTDLGAVEYPFVRVKKLWEDRSRLFEWYEFVAQGGERLLT